MPRFLSVAAGQLVSLVGSALTQWAIPVYVYLLTGSVAQFGLLAVASLVPGLLVAPVAGAVVDRSDRRRVMLAADVASGAVLLALGLLLWSGDLRLWHIYALIVCLAVSSRSSGSPSPRRWPNWSRSGSWATPSASPSSPAAPRR